MGGVGRGRGDGVDGGVEGRAEVRRGRWRKQKETQVVILKSRLCFLPSATELQSGVESITIILNAV